MKSDRHLRMKLVSGYTVYYLWRGFFFLFICYFINFKHTDSSRYYYIAGTLRPNAVNAQIQCIDTFYPNGLHSLTVDMNTHKDDHFDRSSIQPQASEKLLRDMSLSSLTDPRGKTCSVFDVLLRWTSILLIVTKCDSF